MSDHRAVILYAMRELYENKWKNSTKVLKTFFASVSKSNWFMGQEFIADLHGPIPEELREYCAETSSNVVDWAKHNKERLPEGEISLLPDDALYYLNYLYPGDEKKPRIKQVEERIATKGLTSYNYAKEILKGRFEEGEDAIFEELNAPAILTYATKIAKILLPEDIEKECLNQINLISWQNIICERLLDYAEMYRDAGKGRWELFEKMTLREGKAISLRSAPNMTTDLLEEYVKIVQTRIPWLEQWMIKNKEEFDWAISRMIRVYAENVKDCPKELVGK